MEKEMYSIFINEKTIKTEAKIPCTEMLGLKNGFPMRDIPEDQGEISFSDFSDWRDVLKKDFPKEAAEMSDEDFKTLEKEGKVGFTVTKEYTIHIAKQKKY